MPLDTVRRILMRQGAMALHQGRAGEAIGYFKRLASLFPRDIEILLNLAICLRRDNQPVIAVRVIARLLALQPDHWRALLQLGQIHQAAGRLDAAIPPYAAAVRLVPDDNDAAQFLVAALANAGRFAEAGIACERALATLPDNGKLWFNLGVVRARLGQMDGAENAYLEAARLLPGQPEPLRKLTLLQIQQRRGEQALPWLHRLLVLEPTDKMAWSSLGTVLKNRGDYRKSISVLSNAARLTPGITAATLGLCMARLPMIFREEAEMAACRDDYRQNLRQLADAGWETPAALADAADAVCGFQPYYLPYQEQCDLELQKLHGGLVHRVLTARWPQWATTPTLAPPHPDERIRVGIVSGFFRWHTIWKLFLRGWMEFDRNRFQVTAYSTGPTSDATTTVARTGDERFVTAGSYAEMAAKVAEDAPHVLLYPEIGMDNVAAKLAGLRLAPVQCASWGHPETTGLPSMDWFLTSDLMEPDGGEACYSEKVLRLPGLGIRYDRLPVKTQPTDFSRFGIPTDATLFLCCQFLPKYLPQYDALLPRIAVRHPKACFAFISVNKPMVERCLRDRLEAAFAAVGLDAARHVVFLPYLQPGQYAALNDRADIYLDSIGWSGGNTTLEAVAHALPVVTLPGALMRGRHSAAILRQVGVEETIARDPDDYVELALRLAEDSSFRRSVVERMETGEERIYQDRAPLGALEQFLERLVKHSGECQ